MHWIKPIVSMSAILSMAFSLPGCGGTKIYPVKGKVVFADGSAATNLNGYKVEFEALDAKINGKGVSAEGEIGADGTFTLSTLAANDGALPGKHRVLIAPPMPLGDVPAPKRIIESKYSSYETSGLTATVEEKTTEVVLKVDRFKR